MSTSRLILALLLFAATSPAGADATSDFQALLDEAWDAQMASFPTFASALRRSPLQ